MQIPELHDYQRFAVDFVKTHPKCGLFFDMGLGKALDDNTLLPTPSGYKLVKDIQIGDRLFDMDGHTTTVQAIYKHQNKKAYQVTLDDGRSFICCNEHLIPIQINPIKRNAIRAISLQELIDLKASHPDHQFMIPACYNTVYEEREHAIPPRLMGILIRTATIDANGWICFTLPTDMPNPNFTQYAYALIQNKYGHMQESPTCMYLKDVNTNNLLTAHLYKMGYQAGRPLNDQIPTEYLFDNGINRSQFLMGFFLVNEAVNPLDQLKQKCSLKSENAKIMLSHIVWSLGFNCKSKYRPRLKQYELFFNDFLKICVYVCDVCVCLGV